MRRLPWNQHFMRLAEVIAEQSTCLRRQVGAVAVRENYILATGFNGAPRGIPHCEEVGCIRQERGIPSGTQHELCRGAHAEQNVIACAAYNGVSLSGATLYVTHYPCAQCAKILINAGFAIIYYMNDYDDKLAKDLLSRLYVFNVHEKV